MRVTNRGSRKWQVSPGVIARPGESAVVSSDGWRVALGLNPAMPYAVASGEIVVEDDAPSALPAVLESEPDYPEPTEEVVFIEPEPEPERQPELEHHRRKRGRRWQ